MGKRESHYSALLVPNLGFKIFIYSQQLHYYTNHKIDLGCLDNE